MSAYVEYTTLLDEHSDSVHALAFSPCGRYLGSGSQDRSICVWNVPRASFVFRLEFESPINTLLWHPVTKHTLICGCEDGSIYHFSDFLPVSLVNIFRLTYHCMP